MRFQSRPGASTERYPTIGAPQPSPVAKSESGQHRPYVAAHNLRTTSRNRIRLDPREFYDSTVYAVRADIQCKGKDDFSKKSLTVSELRDEVEKAKGFEPAISEFIVATTGPKDAKIEEDARRMQPGGPS